MDQSNEKESRKLWDLSLLKAAEDRTEWKACSLLYRSYRSHVYDKIADEKVLL